MGGNVADYIIITKREFTINAAGPELKNFDFGVPGKSLSFPAIISFMLNNVSDARLRIDVNGQQVVLRNYGTSNIDRCIQEICDPFSPRFRTKNRIVFSVTRGSCTIGDVVLWFQRKT